MTDKKQMTYRDFVQWLRSIADAIEEGAESYPFPYEGVQPLANG